MRALSNPPVAAAMRRTLPCQLAEVREAAKAVRCYLARRGCEETELMDCELALVEACNNAILYANADARQQPVLVEARCDPRQIELRVTDHTPGFEWPETAALPSPESERGRGLYLIQALMDYSAYSPVTGGNVLVMRKKRR